MFTVEQYNAIGKELEELLSLRFLPIAVKKLFSKDEIPEGCYQPSKDRGEHPALCQAFAQVRRNKRSIAMFREDHWCLWPIIAFKDGEMTDADVEYVGTKWFIKDPQMSLEYFKANYPYVKEDCLPGLALAPLSSCTFVPDAVVIYCFPAQLRQLLMASKYHTAKIADASLDTTGSCIFSIVPVLNGEKDYNVSIPDPGEYERALSDENEMIFTVAGDKVGELVESISRIKTMGFGYKELALDMNIDYPRAEFYNKMFEKWGLETGAQWKIGER